LSFVSAVESVYSASRDRVLFHFQPLVSNDCQLIKKNIGELHAELHRSSVPLTAIENCCPVIKPISLLYHQRPCP